MPSDRKKVKYNGIHHISIKETLEGLSEAPRSIKIVKGLILLLKNFINHFNILLKLNNMKINIIQF
jgi:hypothetical protein